MSALFSYLQSTRPSTYENQVQFGELDLLSRRHVARYNLFILRKRAEVAGKATRTVHEALLFLVKRGAGDATVRVNHLVGGCGWSPAYTPTAAADRKKVEVQYSALIQQMTGEAWDDVALTLSTASPAISARGPGLAPFHVVLRSAAPVPNQAYASSPIADLSAQVKAGNTLRNNAVQGGNRKLAFKYRLAVENFGDEAIPVRLLDRVPNADHAKDIRVSLGETKAKLSDDQLYTRLERPKGILRWDITVPAHATGEKAQVVEYGYESGVRPQTATGQPRRQQSPESQVRPVATRSAEVLADGTPHAEA